MAPAKIKITPAALTDFVTRMFVARGMAPSDAALVADNLVWANRRGIGSHGVTRIERYFTFIEQGSLDPTARPHLGMAAGAVWRVDGNKAAGAVAMHLAMSHANENCRTSGVSFGVVSNTTHIGALGYFAEQAANAGLACLLFAAGSPLMTYHGSRVASLHTAPIAFGLPTTTDPIVLDLATSNVANGRLIQARDAGGPIPDDWALTADGERTTDPAKAELLLPLGGPKGSGLALAFEMMSGILAGSSVLIPALAPVKGKRPSANVTLILVDIARFRPLADYRRDASELAGLIKGLPRLDPQAEIRLPGERGVRSMQATTAGVPISAKAWSRICGLAHGIGCEPPDPVA